VFRYIASLVFIGVPEKCSGFDIVQYDAERLMAELGEGFELLEERNEIHTTPANMEQKFTYFWFIKQCGDCK